MRTVFFLLALLGCGASQAQSADEKLALARRVVVVLDLEKQFQAQAVACLNPPADSPLNPGFEFQRNPGHFSGVSPQSIYWPQVEVAYKRYRESICGYMTSAEFLDYIARAFADKASIDALRAALRFYDSPEGREFALANAAVGVIMQGDLVRKMHEAAARADPMIRRELDRIADEYRRAPK